MTDYIINCLVCLLFLSLSRIFHSYGGITIVGERLQNLSLLLASGPLSSEGTGPSIVLRSQLKDPPFMTSKGYYCISRNFSKDPVLALLASLFSLLILSITNNTPCLDLMFFMLNLTKLLKFDTVFFA